MISHTKKLTLALGIMTTAGTINAMQVSVDPTKFQQDCFSVLKTFVPRLSYSGLAFAAGTVGICVGYDGFKRLCNGYDKNEHRTKVTGASEMTVGLGTTLISVAIISKLWHKL